MHGLIFLVLFIAFLYLGRPILIPLLMAVFLWYLINAISAYYRKAMPRATSHKWLATIFDALAGVLAVGTFVGVAYMFTTQVRPMFSELYASLPEIQNRLVAFAHYVSTTTGIQIDASMLPNMTRVASMVGASAAAIAASVGMIIIYMLFMFVEQSTFGRKINALAANKTRAKKMHYILESIDDNMKKYLFMKTAISAATGLLSYAWLHTLGLQFAGVWAFTIFILNYVPTIGSILACALPIIFSLTVSTSLQTPLLVAAGLIGLQILFGNILEPKLTGRTLNLSTLAILINLVFWGTLWGVAGMFFSVPLLVALFIVTAQFDSTRWIAVLLSADGNIPDKSED